MRPLNSCPAKSPPRSTLLALLSGVALTVACADQPVSPEQTLGASELRTPANQAAQDALERPALTELTRAMALALADDRARHLVLSDMRASRHTHEHKLELSRYLRPNGASHLLTAMANATQTSKDSILALVARVRPLEFYMPIPQQRETWVGSGEVVVASLLDDDDAPIAFDVRGSRIELDGGGAPTAPTLAIVPAETDFSTPLNTAGLNNRRASASAIGTWIRAASGDVRLSADEDCDPRTSKTECDGPTSGGPGYGVVPATAPGGLYMTWTSLDDDGEPLLKGSPEIEAYVVGPWTIDGPNVLRVITYAGEDAAGLRYFNQDGESWKGYVMLLSQADFAMHHYIDTLPLNRQFSVVLYEDDDTRGMIRDDPMRLANLLSWLAGAGAGGYALKKICEQDEEDRASSDTQCALGIWGVFIGTVYILWKLAQTNDDFLGLAIEKSLFPNYYSTSANFALLRGLLYSVPVQNGGIRLVYHPAP